MYFLPLCVVLQALPCYSMKSQVQILFVFFFLLVAGDADSQVENKIFILEYTEKQMELTVAADTVQ